MKKLSVALLALCLSGAAFAQLSGSYTFGGSTTVAPIAYAAIEELRKTYPDARISYEATGSGAGLKSLLAGKISLSGSSADYDAKTLDRAVATPVALDGLSVVVNKSVRLANISLSDLAKIYHGDITNWKDVGGPDARIVVVNRDESSGTYASFWEIVCQKDFGKAVSYVKTAIVAKENGEVAAKVTATPDSIGYVGMAFADEVIKQGGRRLMVDGVADTIPNVVAKKYPIARTLFVLTLGAPKAGTAERIFLDFVLSPRGQAIVRSTGYIPLPR